MKRTMTGLALLMASAAPVLAGGIERAPQSLAVLFEEGNYVELSFGGVDPTVKGRDVAPAAVGGPYDTGDVAQGYGFLGLAYKHQFNENLSGAFIVEQPFGSDLRYPTFADGGSLLLGGTRVEVNSTTYTGILRYKFQNNFSVHGGLRASHADGGVTLGGAAYQGRLGPQPYDLDIGGAWGVGWVAGVAYEIPEYAARISLTYNSEIDHDFEQTETGGPLAPATFKGDYEVTTPRSWTLEGQTGIAEDTLMFGSIRWVKWSEFKVDNFLFPIVTPEGTIPLVELEDTTTYTIGVGRKFTENWAGSIAYIYEPSVGGKISPLAPYDGRKGVQVAAIYTMDNIKVSTGINYSKLGDADLGVGYSGDKTEVGETNDNDLWGFGVRIGYSF
ncbi:outer membrane protein transport protein [Paracoccus sp. MBLB3053]|uniref:Outer membrane protein transport protein n=1 Tax=Paracoccus aurantius TaxID=3073814 RepID=A0ABU2HQ98_9RHOB|nr:outer membrane protein transport protein [Paracoccus sp. MBLB3053]MDS9467223.1 outer membrane protein transport protein [Paracoccus sp. MBLB3053]